MHTLSHTLTHSHTHTDHYQPRHIPNPTSETPTLNMTAFNTLTHTFKALELRAVIFRVGEAVMFRVGVWGQP